MHRLTFDEEAHLYYWEEQPVFNVTSVIEMTGLTNFAFINQGDLQMACEFGTYTHKITIYVDLKIDNREDIANLNDALKEKYKNFNIKKCLLRNYATYQKFLSEHEYKPLIIEERLFSQKHRFAGTPDRICMIDGKPYILDFKTGVLSNSAGWQTSAYKILLAENMPKYKNIKRAILHFKNEGDYDLILEGEKNKLDVFDQSIFPDKQVFLSALTLCHLGFADKFKKKAEYHFQNS